MNTNNPKVERLAISVLPPSDPAVTTTTLDKPISEEARTVVAAAMAKEIPFTKQRFLTDLKKVSKRRP
ncbi:MAG: hypothetical protein ACR2ME_00060 [Acidimicrobiia bacterium]